MMTPQRTPEALRKTEKDLKGEVNDDVTMTSVLGDKNVRPTDECLASVLADSKQLWDSIKGHIASEYGNFSEEWKFYGAKAGWTLAVFSGKRRLANLIPMHGHFQTGFTLSEKAVAMVKGADLPASVKASIEDAAGCVCGSGLMLTVRTADDADIAKKLLGIKEES